MGNIVKYIGLLIMIWSLVPFLFPKVNKAFYSLFQKNERAYHLGGIYLAFGGMLILASPSCRHEGIVLLIGVFVGLTGLSFFLTNIQNLKTVLGVVQNSNEKVKTYGHIFDFLIGGIVYLSV